MKMPDGYNESAAYTGEFESLSLGGHICRIVSAKEEFAQDGAQRLALAFDIDDSDPQGGFYRNQYNFRKGKDINAAWPATFRQRTEGKSLPFFKGMITAIENSNPGYTFTGNETTLKGKKFLGVFGREEFIGQDNNCHWATKCFFIRSLDQLDKVEVPADKPLPESKKPFSAPQGFTQVEKDEDLPF